MTILELLQQRYDEILDKYLSTLNEEQLRNEVKLAINRNKWGEKAYLREIVVLENKVEDI